MKSRIVQNLYSIYKGNDNGLGSKIAQETDIDEKKLPKLAKTVLEHLLHDYSHFSVVTIDSFFQKVIRAFAREMSLNAGYEVELDQDSTLDKAIDLMLDDIENNEYLKDWLVEWAKRKIEEGKSWNPKSDMLKLGKEIFNEELQNIDLPKITDKENLERYRAMLQNLVNGYWDYLQRNGQKAVSIMERYGLDVDSFNRKGTGVGGYFYKLAGRKEAKINAYVANALESIEGWYSKSSKQKEIIIDAYNGGLGEILQNTADYQKEHERELTTAVAILKQICVLGVLCDMMRSVDNYTHDRNMFLISKSSGFLKKIIDNSDTPFIYERAGNFYNHFMIDEFQDTSSIQWENFYPLVKNSLSSGHSNLIVGDVKQSIYRWRNADWKILSKKVGDDLDSYGVQVQNLAENRRSAREIIDFNNAFFREAVEQMCAALEEDEKEAATGIEYLTAEMKEAYNDCYQRLPEKDKEDKKDGEQQNDGSGYVHLTMIAEEENSEASWRDMALEEMIARIEQLKNSGYKLSEIAILVREKKDAKLIADKLLENNYNVLSNESLLIDNSSAVKWLVAAMRYIVEPENKINRAYLEYENSKIQRFKDSRIQENDEDVDYRTVGNRKSEIGSRKSEIGQSDNRIIGLSNNRNVGILELSEKLINQYDLYQDVGQAPFLQAFQDILLQYARRENTDIRSFLDWWEIEKNSKYIAMPDNQDARQDAVQLLTIHKSKGLERDAIIIPFCDWALCKSGDTLWCQPAEKPFSDMKSLPLIFGKDLRNTIFEKEYLEEKTMSYIDNLNLLYVAFTRAKKTLFISLPLPKKEGGAFTGVNDLICRCFNQPLSYPALPDNGEKRYINLNENWNSETLCFELGKLTPKELKINSSELRNGINEFNFKTRNPVPAIPHITRNSDCFSVDGAKNTQIDRGLLLHDIFRNMVTVTDLEHRLNALIIEGKLPESERTLIFDMVHSALENPTVSRWFAPGVKVKTEAEILLPDGSTARPDRTVFDGDEVHVIDYKFGKYETENHRSQVRRYMDYMREMGHGSVTGFVWYVTLNRYYEIK